jgi:hypothetical protein
MVRPQGVGVLLEIGALEGGRPVPLDEQQTNAVRQQLLSRQEAGQDALPQVRESARPVFLARVDGDGLPHPDVEQPFPAVGHGDRRGSGV